MKKFTLPKDGGLLEGRVPQDIIHTYEKIPTEVFEDASDASESIAKEIIASINAFQPTAAKKTFKLGLSTGKTPTILYGMLCEAYKKKKVSFKDVEVFSIDEYYPIPAGSQQSRTKRLHESLLDIVDVSARNLHILDGTVKQNELPEYCAKFEEAAREMDLLVLGIGDKAQVGFNEAGSAFQSRTRVVQLPYASRKRQVKNFNNDMAKTPSAALTIGLGTMISAKRVILMAWGEDKVEAVHNIVELRHNSEYPASYFQFHTNVSLVIDRIAAEKLVREESPWLLGSCEWTPKFRRKAVVWLCGKVGKPITKLTQQDYLQNGLGELLEQYGPYDKINIDVFNDLQHTITGWPGGKPNADDATRPVSSKPFPKKVLIFSPHPDDDVISMGGTFIRLVHQGHDVHVAYETSGDVAVHDDVVLQHMDAAYQLGFGDKFDKVKKLIDSKTPGAPEPRELLDIKAAIRRSEARGACRSFGLKMDNVHFLNLPFYESGGIAKKPRTQVDVDIIKALLKKLKPDQIYMAGDLADPHGTHRVCTEAAMEAMDQLRNEGEKWIMNSHVWLYRGAWMEWELGRVDMAVPLSPDEVVEKRHAIYHHLSQKDIVPFPGDDPREFWQRAEDRTSTTARMYDALGMAEYQAIEVFLKLY